MSETGSSTRGGYRPGSGSKPGPYGRRIATSCTLTPDVIAYINGQDESRSEVLDRIVRDSAEFKQWQAEQSEK